MSETTPEPSPAEDAPEPEAPQDIVCHGTTALPALGGDD